MENEQYIPYTIFIEKLGGIAVRNNGTGDVMLRNFGVENGIHGEEPGLMVFYREIEYGEDAQGVKLYERSREFAIPIETCDNHKKDMIAYIATMKDMQNHSDLGDNLEDLVAIEMIKALKNSPLDSEPIPFKIN